MNGYEKCCDHRPQFIFIVNVDWWRIKTSGGGGGGGGDRPWNRPIRMLRGVPIGSAGVKLDTYEHET